MRYRGRLIKCLILATILFLLYKASSWQEESSLHMRAFEDEVHLGNHEQYKQYIKLKQRNMKAKNVTFKDWNDDSMKAYSKERRCPPRKAILRKDITPLLHLLSSSPLWEWIKTRIEHSWPDWMGAVKSTERWTQTFQQKNILVIPGLMKATTYADPKVIAAGGPLGELLQWADLIAGLYILGHNISIEHDYKDGGLKLLQLVDNDVPVSCGSGYDLIYADVLAMNELPPPVRKRFRCRFRVLDVYGTQAMHNDPEYREAHMLKSHGGGLGLHLKQFYTFYPQTPDNSFLGFVVKSNRNTTAKENIGLLYGKDPRYARGHIHSVSLLTKYLDIHYTMSENLHQSTRGLLKWEGVLSGEAYGKLLDRTKIYIGLGDPIEGTGVMEALAHGCVFINPKVFGTHQAHFIERKKPTQRLLTSQIPYVEQYIGPPWVRTVDMDNFEELVQVVEGILTNHVFEPFIPEEFSMCGYLKRVAHYIEYQDFCTYNQDTTWPPLDLLEVILGKDGQSCEKGCHEHGLVCEPVYFKHINQKSQFDRFGVNCSGAVTGPEVIYPAVDTSYDNMCWLQEEAGLFSCAIGITDYKRLCPCRRYRRYQVALWD